MVGRKSEILKDEVIVRIHSVKIENYKCFDVTDTIELDPHMNLLVGKNSSGKSAFLETLQPIPRAKSHQSVKKKPRVDYVIDNLSRVEFVVQSSGEEITDLLLSLNEFYVMLATSVSDERTARAALDSVITGGDIFSAKYERRVDEGGATNPDWTTVPIFGSVLSSGLNAAIFRPNRRTRGFDYSQTSATGKALDFGVSVIERLLQRVYRFVPQRVIPPVCTFAEARELAPDASNLATALLSMTPDTAEEFDRLVQRVLPVIQVVRADPIGNQVRILVWSKGVPLSRKDLAMPLNECGSGVGQVVAILFVLLTAQTPRTICIDEPNSFLHPDAARDLIEVFRDFPQHQFVIATHSPEVIAAANTGKAFLFKWNEGKSDVLPSEKDGVAAARQALAEVGAKLSDVFSYDRVLWVEGPTEEKCFPRIPNTKGFNEKGTIILGVADPNSFSSKRGAEVWRIYCKLSHSQALIPPAVGLILDRDGRSDTEMTDLTRESKGQIRFLPREMFENYLIHASAIAQTINKLVEGCTLSPDSVTDWIRRNGGDVKLFRPREPQVPMCQEWFVQVNGAKLMSKLFADLSDCDLQYVKTSHGPMLVEDVLAIEPHAFDEIKPIVEEVLSPHA
jgi:energy-coupling factor transporter ATP-binding protein EcfA2